MSDKEIIELRLTRQEAHVVLRALAGGDAEGDTRCRTWIAERLLRFVAPDLGPQPLAAILARAVGDADAKPASADGEKPK